MKLRLLLFALICVPCAAETLSHGRFQDMTIYRPAGKIDHVVLFLSGEQGWNAPLAESAQLLASRGALVAGIDSRSLFAGLERDAADCVFPDGDLENLSRFLQAYYHLPAYEPAVLVGYAAGASMAYAIIAQAPAGTFAGAVSVEFCPELKVRKPLCEDGALRYAAFDKEHSKLLPVQFDAPWITVQTHVEGTCGKAVAQRFVSIAGNAELIMLPGNAKAAKWTSALASAVQRLSVQHSQAAVIPEDLEGLPVIEVEAKQSGETLAVLISGDGGWAGIDKAVAAALAAQGIPVIGMDSLRYFWRARTPQSTANDVDRILRHYLAAWDKKDAVLIGYSQGADVLPFIANRLPSRTRARVRLAVMLGLGETAAFEFHLSDWVSDAADGLPIRPELQRMSGMPALCVYGVDERDSLCPIASGRMLRAVSLPGGHHFDGDYGRLAALILEHLHMSPLRIGKLANLTGRSVHTIRWYESQRLIPGVRWHCSSACDVGSRSCATTRHGSQRRGLGARAPAILHAHRNLIEQRIAELTQALDIVDGKIEFYAKWLSTGVAAAADHSQEIAVNDR